MKRVPVLTIAICGFLLCIPSLTQAMLIKVDFIATGFKDALTDYDYPPPDDLVSGFIVYNAVSEISNIASLESVALTIAHHTYEIGETGFYPSPPYNGDVMMIGGKVWGVNGVSPGYDDFWLEWTKSERNFPTITYSSTRSPGTNWVTRTFSKFIVEPVPEPIPEPIPEPVPEPSTMLLLGSGLVGLVGYGRRQFRKC